MTTQQWHRFTHRIALGAVLSLAIAAVDCSRIEAPRTITLSEALDRFDWATSTEADFWAKYPQLVGEYFHDVEVQL